MGVDELARSRLVAERSTDRKRRDLIRRRLRTGLGLENRNGRVEDVQSPVVDTPELDATKGLELEFEHPLTTDPVENQPDNGGSFLDRFRDRR
jgi:hypothetical protein